MLIDTVSFGSQALARRYAITSFHARTHPLRANVIADPPEVEIIAVTADAARNVTLRRLIWPTTSPTPIPPPRQALSRHSSPTGSTESLRTTVCKHLYVTGKVVNRMGHTAVLSWNTSSPTLSSSPTPTGLRAALHPVTQFPTLFRAACQGITIPLSLLPIAQQSCMIMPQVRS